MVAALSTTKQISEPGAGRLTLHFIIGWAALNILAACWAGFALLQSREHYEERAEATTQNLAAVLDQSISGNIGKIDLTLRAIVDELERRLREIGKLDPQQVNGLLSDHQERLFEPARIRVSDDAGFVILGADVSPEHRVQWGDHDVFGRLRVHDGLSVSNPLLGRVSKIWLISFARRYRHPDGNFAGIISVSIPVEYFQELLGSLQLGQHGVASLRDSNLGLIARYPPRNSPEWTIGARVLSTELQSVVASGRPVVTYRSTSAADGSERTNTYRCLSVAPFHLVVGLGTSDYLEGWHDEMRQTLVHLAFFALVTLLGAWMIWRGTMRVRREAECRQLLLTELKELQEALQAANTSLEKQVAQRTAQLRQLTMETSIAEEKERQVIAQELHDDLGQLLYAAKVKIDMLAKPTSRQHGQTAQFDELRNVIGQASMRVRTLTAQLSPPVLKQLGLVPALTWLGEEMERVYGLHVEIRTTDCQSP